MFGDCHIHVAMDGVNFKAAMARFESGIDDEIIRSVFSIYRDRGILFLRDGGDAYGVSERAKSIAPEFGIDYRTPIFAIHKRGFYGGIVGKAFDDMSGYAALVAEAADRGADFIKIMTTGIMDFSVYGRIVGGEGLPAEEVRDMVRIAHEAGLAVMAHTNGARAVLDAIEAGVDSIEHGNYIDDECVAALVESGICLVPTSCIARNLIGREGFDDGVLERIWDQSAETIASAIEEGALVACGSDGGAVGTPHGQGTFDEYSCLCDAVPDRISRDGILRIAEDYIQCTFCREEEDPDGE